jgi:hypothetical protein
MYTYLWTEGVRVKKSTRRSKKHARGSKINVDTAHTCELARISLQIWPSHAVHMGTPCPLHTVSSSSGFRHGCPVIILAAAHRDLPLARFRPPAAVPRARRAAGVAGPPRLLRLHPAQHRPPPAVAPRHGAPRRPRCSPAPARPRSP